MPFAPDILVTGLDEILLVVQAALTLPDLEQTEQELERYMLGMRCPAGVLITPQRMWVYHDLYSSPPSIERLGEFDSRLLWQQTPPTDATSFEVFVQHWLEDLASQPTENLPGKIREVLREYLIPAVAEGEVRAAHLRYFS